MNTNFDTTWNKAFQHTFHKMPLAVAVGDGSFEPVNNSAIVYRSDGLELKPVSTGFEIVQPDELREVFRPLIDTGKVTMKSGQWIKDGSALLMRADLKNAFADIVPNDFIKGEILAWSGFDGGLNIGGSVSISQGRCLNILPAVEQTAMREVLNAIMGTAGSTRMHGRRRQIASFRTRHTKNVRIRLEAVEKTIAEAYQAFQQSVEVFRAVAAKPATEAKLEAYVRRVFEMTEPAQEETEERSAQFETKVNRVIELLDTQRGLEMVPAARGTMWQGYSAVTEYLTHEAGRSEDTRINSILFGQNAAKSRTALALALQ